MPRGDGTGPLGQGPRTGRAAGYCAGYDVPGYMNPAFGRRFVGGRGRGGGFRWYWRYHPGYPPYPHYPVYPDYPAPPAPYQMEPKDEIKYLEGMAQNIRKELEDIEKRISELSQAGTE